VALRACALNPADLDRGIVFVQRLPLRQRIAGLPL
jgi:hypothetical protein